MGPCSGICVRAEATYTMASVGRSDMEAHWWDTAACANEVCRLYSKHCPGSLERPNASKWPHPRGNDLAGAVQVAYCPSPVQVPYCPSIFRQSLQKGSYILQAGFRCARERSADAEEQLQCCLLLSLTHFKLQKSVDYMCLETPLQSVEISTICLTVWGLEAALRADHPAFKVMSTAFL